MKRLAVTAGLVVALFAFATPAFAHVTVSAPGATSGGSDQEITFRVPVEQTDATTAFTVALPTDTPIASVLVKPIAGWTHTEKTAKLAKPISTDDGDITEAVSQITWTASAGHGLKPGEYGEFTIIAGQLPQADSLKFSAIQTYADGKSVKWNEVAAPGSSAEPENPAPVLDLTATASTAKPAKAASTTGVKALAIVALALAAAALGLAIVSRARRETT